METTEIIKNTIRWGCLKAHRMAQKIQHQQGVTKHPPSNPILGDQITTSDQEIQKSQRIRGCWDVNCKRFVLRSV